MSFLSDLFHPTVAPVVDPPTVAGVPVELPRIVLMPPAAAPAPDCEPLWYPGTGAILTAADYQWAATSLGCEVAMIRAVKLQEGGTGFIAGDPLKRPTILFEAAKFGAATDNRYDGATGPDGTVISRSSWARGQPYGAGGVNQWNRLAAAADLGNDDDTYEETREAALNAASYGLFQVLGSGFKSLGFSDIDSLVKAMCASEHDQLDVFMTFIRRNNLVTAMRTRNFLAFATGYNGRGQAQFYADQIQAKYLQQKRLFP